MAKGYTFYNGEQYTCWILEQGFLIPPARLPDDDVPLEHVQFLADTSGWSLNLNKAELLAQKLRL